MARINFEDLPSTNTPITANNLNKLNNLIISSTEPNTGEEVWFQKGKNLLDVLGISSTTINGITFTNNGNGTFTLNGTADGHAELYLLGNNNINVEIPGNYVYGGIDSNVKVRVVNGSSSTSSEGSSTAIDKSTYTKGYVEILVIWGTTVNNVVVSPMLTMEEDNTFEPYINKTIYTKNNNGVYEEFYDESEMNKETYSTEETRIGTWIDGKPLYRKVIEFTVNDTSQILIPHNISNLSWVTKCDTSIYNQYGYYMASSKDIIDVNFDSNYIYFTSGWPTGSAKLIMEYTKN